VNSGALGISTSFDCYKGQLTVVASTLGQPIANLKAVLFKSGRSTTNAQTNTLGEAIFSIYEDGDYFVVVDDPYSLGNTKQTDVTGLKLCLRPAAENTTQQNQTQPALPRLPTLPRWRGCGSPIGAVPPSPVAR